MAVFDGELDPECRLVFDFLEVGDFWVFVVFDAEFAFL